MDNTQLLLTVILTVTTFFMILIGIQLIFVLKELRTALKKINNIIEGFEKVGINLEHGFHEFVGFFTGFKTIFKIFEHLSSKKNGKQK
ncbi:MAG: hypothetical protein QHH09_04510 [Microgenomates group bacterium]|nr:hypothetical protein [Microgenomates group bacterium]